MKKQDYLDALIAEYLEWTKILAIEMTKNQYGGIRMMQTYFEKIYDTIYERGFKDGAKILNEQDTMKN